eukprot:CAMPEP_0181229070 /NCGR_PEP_ID=MMETSP1096-20121128/33693_1 /TAXON_ID=156174 ORGANISM="Chrysochromulina ericina, Strain CCMP281" /NCGR_SAMPLE_ID=MMETSP1096 /ASSEMBLY_ACC=CAM_ASM_000453 /LENGTH=118 /DNA_ID=CAMNT_0023322653 /DNA_START=1320 /DNA_END=1676 /DNA_ORIENTATION=-
MTRVGARRRLQASAIATSPATAPAPAQERSADVPAPTSTPGYVPALARRIAGLAASPHSASSAAASEESLLVPAVRVLAVGGEGRMAAHNCRRAARRPELRLDDITAAAPPAHAAIVR